MIDFFECPTDVAIVEVLEDLRVVEDRELRALYAAWFAGTAKPAEWWVRAGRPAPPRPRQGTTYRPGFGWVHSNRLPKRTIVIPAAGGGAAVAVSRDRDNRSPADSVSRRPRRARAALTGRFRAAVEASETRVSALDVLRDTRGRGR